MKVYGDTSSEFGFTSERDGIAGLVFLRARHYDPGTGRFITKDPFPGVQSLPSTLHPYQYALNNPINWADPSGEIIPAILIALAAGAIIGGIGGGINFALNNQGMSLGDMFSSGCFWRSVGIGAAAGAIAGLVGWAVPYWLPFIGINVQAGFGAAIMGGFITGALASGAGQVTTNLLTGEKWSKGIGWALLTGGVTGGITGGIGFKIRQLFSNSQIRPFKELPRKLGYERHHLIEQRLAARLGVDPGDIPSVYLTPKDHRPFTNAWRALIGYKNSGSPNTITASWDDILNAAQEIYENYPAYLKAVNQFMKRIK